MSKKESKVAETPKRYLMIIWTRSNINDIIAGFNQHNLRPIIYFDLTSTYDEAKKKYDEVWPSLSPKEQSRSELVPADFFDYFIPKSTS